MSSHGHLQARPDARAANNIVSSAMAAGARQREVRSDVMFGRRFEASAQAQARSIAAGLPREKCCGLVTLLDTTRVLSQYRYARDNKSFGLTTLATDTSVSSAMQSCVEFPRQGRRATRGFIDDKRIARIVRTARSSRPAFVPVLTDSGERCPIDSARSMTTCGAMGEFTAKDSAPGAHLQAVTLLACTALPEKPSKGLQSEIVKSSAGGRIA